MTERLRGLGHYVRYEHSGSFKAQLRIASQAGARAVVIIGDREVEKGCVAVKNMRSGVQVEVGAGSDLTDLSAHINAIISEESTK